MGDPSSAKLPVVTVWGRQISRASLEKAIISSATFLVVFNAVMIPFALPKMRRYVGAPYLPSNRLAFRAVLDHLPELSKPGLRVADIGSGDGGLLLEAAKNSGPNFGLGIEMNPWLVLLSKWRCWWHKKNENKISIVWGNAWTSSSKIAQFDPDLIAFYGRPGGKVLEKFGALAETVSDETGKPLLIASNKFPIPGWQLRQIAEINDFHIYKLHANKI